MYTSNATFFGYKAQILNISISEKNADTKEVFFANCLVTKQ